MLADTLCVLCGWWVDWWKRGICVCKYVFACVICVMRRAIIPIAFTGNFALLVNPFNPRTLVCAREFHVHKTREHPYTPITPAQRVQLTNNPSLRNTDSPNFTVINKW